MKKIILSFFILLIFLNTKGQDNIGTPYSIFGYGLLPDNHGPYAAMGGVSAAMRDKRNVNFLNPASYTALDSNRFYFQGALAGEYTSISTNKESSYYNVAQNAYLTMAFRLYRNMFFSFGFTEKSDVGYDILYSNLIAGAENVYFNQNIEGEGGLNDLYGGVAWRYKNLSLGMNFSYLFGKLEKRQTLMAQLESSYYIKTSENNRIHDLLFNPGFQYDMKLSAKSRLIIGSSMNFTQKLSAEKEFISYIVSTGSGQSTILDNEVLKKGYIKYPFRINSGFDYQYKNKWQVAGDYTFQKMSVYEEFRTKKQLKNYHKGSLGVSWTPEEMGRKWWQRNKYMAGSYFSQSGIELKNKSINSYGVTFGAQIPFFTNRGGELLLGVACDLGIRGNESNGLIQEKYAKVKINIAFKELWFAKRKIN